MLELALAALASYLLGSIPTGIIAGKLARGIDLREQGSGNTGATNSFRVLGWRLGSAVALVDIAKGYAAVALASRIAPPSASSLPGGTAFIVASLAAVLGHVKPLFAGFRGGKGVATAAGALLAAAPLPAAFAALAFALVLLSTGVVSLSSLAAALAFPATLLAGLALGRPVSPLLLGFSLVLAPLIFYTHRSNLARLRRGEEKRFERLRVLGRLLDRFRRR